jgi:hypothetical protein
MMKDVGADSTVLSHRLQTNGGLMQTPPSALDVAQFDAGV